MEQKNITHEAQAFHRAVASFCSIGNDRLVPYEALPTIFRRLGVNLRDDEVYALVREHLPEDGTVISESLLLDIFLGWLANTKSKLRHDTDPIMQPRNLEIKFIRAHTVPRAFWIVLVMTCALVQWASVLSRDADSGILHRTIEPISALIFDIVCSVLFAIDIVLWARTRSSTSAFVSDDPRVVACSYFKSWFFVLDLLATIPFDVVFLLVNLPAPSGILSHLRLLKVIRFILQWIRDRSTLQAPLTPTTITVFFRIIPMWLLLYLIMAILFVCAAVLQSVSPRMNFLQSVYAVIQIFTTVGYGDHVHTADWKPIWFTIFLFFLGLLVNAVGIGRLVGLIQLKNAKSNADEKLRETLAVLQYFNVPTLLQREILSFQNHALSNDVTGTFSDELSGLPESFHRGLVMQKRIDTLRQSELFAGAGNQVVVELVNAMVITNPEPEHYLSYACQPHGGLRFIFFGFVGRYDPTGQFITTLRTDDIYGYEGLADMKDETYTHKSLTYVHLAVLPAECIHIIAQKYPLFREIFEEKIPTCAAREQRANQKHHQNRRRSLRAASISNQSYSDLSISAYPNNNNAANNFDQQETSRFCQHPPPAEQGDPLESESPTAQLSRIRVVQREEEERSAEGAEKAMPPAIQIDSEGGGGGGDELSSDTDSDNDRDDRGTVGGTPPSVRWSDASRVTELTSVPLDDEEVVFLRELLPNLHEMRRRIEGLIEKKRAELKNKKDEEKCASHQRDHRQDNDNSMEHYSNR